MELEVFKRPLKVGDIVSGSGYYQSQAYLYVIIGFTPKNIKVHQLCSPTSYGCEGLKAEVVLIENAQKYLIGNQQQWYEAICKKYNIQ